MISLDQRSCIRCAGLIDASPRVYPLHPSGSNASWKTWWHLLGLRQKMHRIAPCLPSTKLLRLNAEKAPFFVTKLGVRVMPSVLFFQDGITNSRLLGFEGLIEDDAGEDFPTSNVRSLDHSRWRLMSFPVLMTSVPCGCAGPSAAGSTPPGPRGG